MFLSKREHPVKTKTHREDEHVKAEVEIEIMLPQTKGCLETTRSWKVQRKILL